MSTDQAKTFLKKLHQNEKLQEQLVSEIDSGSGELTTDEAIQSVITFASDQGYGFSTDDYETATAELHPDGELSEEELEQLSGGGFFGDIGSWLDDRIDDLKDNDRDRDYPPMV